MLVRCPSCETTYQVADELIGGPNTTFRCSRCKHVFALEVEPDEEAESPSAPPASETESERRGHDQPFSSPPPDRKETGRERPAQGLRQEKLFDFDRPKEPPLVKGPEPRQPEFPSARMDKIFPPREESAGTSTSVPPSYAAEQARNKERSFPPGESKEEETPTVPQAGPSSDTEAARPTFSEFEENWERFSPAPNEGEATASDAERERPASTVPYFTLFTVLLLLYSTATLVHQTRPSALESLLRTVPWLGASLFRNNHLRQGIALQSLRPSFQTIDGNREVFVVSGVAHNRNTVSVREIQIEGRVYDAQGKEVGQQAIWVGNAITPKILKDLTAQEISILQKASPQKRFEIPSQKAASFVIVFLRPQGTIKNFSCRVASAEGAA